MKANQYTRKERAHYHYLAQAYLSELINIYKASCGRCKKELDINNRQKYNIHHIDGEISHNDISNLILLCVSCHRKTHWDQGDQPRTYDRVVKKRLGYNRHELKDAGIRYDKKLMPWEEIKDMPGAKYKGLGLGIVKTSRFFIEYGHPCTEFAKYLGISRQRVAQLANRNSPRLMEIKKILDMGIDTGQDP